MKDSLTGGLGKLTLRSPKHFVPASIGIVLKCVISRVRNGSIPITILYD